VIQPSLRVDAERNRQRILGAAQALFAEYGLDVPLEEIARQAGVGIATLYRRFPTRGELIAATFERKIADYAAAIELARHDPDPWAGFCGLIHDLCARQAADAGLKELLALDLPKSAVMTELMSTAETSLALLIRDAKACGGLRADFELNDFSLVLVANAGVITNTRQLAPDRWRRFVAYLIDAFRADGANR
jgi:AcrR family transcriptional regulator